MEVYNEDVSLQTFLRLLWGLSFVPPRDIVEIYENFVLPKAPYSENDEDEDYNDNLDKFLQYFERTYIGKRDPRTRDRRRPLFGFEIWNKFFPTISEEDSSTNRSESWNKNFQESLPRNANIWAVIKHLALEESLLQTKVHQAVITPPGNIENDGSSRRNIKIQAKKRQLQSLVRRYEDMNTDTFFRSLLTFYNVGEE